MLEEHRTGVMNLDHRQVDDVALVEPDMPLSKQGRPLGQRCS